MAYADIESLKTYVGYQGDDDTRLAELVACLEAASETIDGLTDRTFDLSLAEDRQYRVSNDGCHLITDDIGDSTITVTVDGTATTDFYGEPFNSIAKSKPITSVHLCGWRAPGTVVTVNARFGWPAVPAPIVRACLVQAARLYKRADSIEGVGSFGDGITFRFARVDPDVMALVGPYVRTAL